MLITFYNICLDIFVIVLIFVITKKQNNMKILNSFRAVIENSATNRDKVIVWAIVAMPLLMVVLAFGRNLK